MNTLSWFLYAVNVMDVLPKVLMIFLSVLALALLGYTVTVIGASDMLKYSSNREYYLQIISHCKKVIKKLLVLGSVLLILIPLIPSKDTLYAIAASELGEQVLESEVGLKAQAAIKAWIDGQLEK